MTVYVVVDGKQYSGFLRMEFSRSFESLCSTMSLTCSAIAGHAFPIQRSKPVKVYIDDFILFTGYIESLEVHYGVGQHEIVLACRDTTCDVIDSSLLGGTEFNSPVTLQTVAEQVLAANGLDNILVFDETGGITPFSANDIVASEISQTIFEFLEKYCRKRQVFMTSNEYGNLCFVRAGTVDTGAMLMNIIGSKNNNILESNVCFKESERFNRYVVHSQINTTSRSALALRNRTKTFVGSNKRQLNKHISAQSGEAIDPEIRSSRVKEIISMTAANIEDCANQASWYANVYRARSTEYRAKVQGFYLPSKTDIWRINRLIGVQDDFCDIYAVLMIKDVKYSYSVTEGSTVELTMVDKDAFTLQALIDSQQKAIDKSGDSLTDDANDDETPADDPPEQSPSP